MDLDVRSVVLCDVIARGQTKSKDKLVNDA